jgi:uncharacterized protein YndB with AHSA1/START domain
MASVEDSIVIQAPIDHVFSAVTDPRRTLEWNPSIVEVSDISGYPVHVGSSWHQVASVAGRMVKLTCRIVELRPPFEGILDVSGDQHGRVVTRCQESGGHTRLSQMIEFVPPTGMMGRMALTVIQPALKRELSHTLARQKDILEREVGAGSGSETS